MHHQDEPASLVQEEVDFKSRQTGFGRLKEKTDFWKREKLTLGIWIASVFKPCFLFIGWLEKKLDNSSVNL